MLLKKPPEQRQTTSKFLQVFFCFFYTACKYRPVVPPLYLADLCKCQENIMGLSKFLCFLDSIKGINGTKSTV